MKYNIPVTAEQFLGNSKKYEKSEEKKKLEEELKELNQLATKAVPEAVRKEYGMQYMDFDNTTDEELREKAEATTKQRIADEKEDLTRKNAEKVDIINAQIENNNKQTELAKKEVEERFDKMKSAASDDALKRGMGRSSVIVNLLKEYDGEKAKTLDEKDVAANEVVAKLNDEISALKVKLDSALEQADMRTAFEINEELAALKNKRDKENEKVLRYNNSLSEKLGELKKQLEKSKVRKSVVYEAEQLANEYNNQMQDKLLKYYAKLSPEEIIEDFENGDYDKLLSPNIYKRIKTYVDSKR